MSNAIGWTDMTWNPPVRGCSKADPSCENCYAMKMAHRLGGSGIYPDGITRKGKHGVEWTGVVSTGAPEEVRAHADAHLPRRARKRVFVGSMFDLFHKRVPFAFLDAVFSEMACRPHLTFQLLTKRPDQVVKYWRHADRLASDVGSIAQWPSNVWMGTSVPDQKRADERVPLLLELPAPVLWLSMEPLLGPVILRQEWLLGRFEYCPEDNPEPECWPDSDRLGPGDEGYDPCAGCPAYGPDCHAIRTPSLSWIVAGGESGSRARPSDPDWFRDLLERCRDTGVAFYMKQMWQVGRSKLPIPPDLMIREWPHVS